MNSEQYFSQHTLQHIKAQEFHEFFTRFRGKYTPHLNHLGEIHWMSAEEATDQHEFFDYEPNLWHRIKRKFAESRSVNLSQLSPEERELRLQIRRYLEKRYLGEVQPETRRMLPASPEINISDDDIEHIPVSRDAFEDLFHWNKSVTVPVILVVVLAIFGVAHALHRVGSNNGSILIESNVRGAAIFLNGEKRGYADFRRLLSDVPPGNYTVELRKIGFASKPAEVAVEKNGNATAKVFISMSPLGVTDQGFLTISAEQSDSKVFVNDEFIGTLSDQPVIALAAGDHNITIEKEGYRTAPPSRWVHINSGDTARVQFEQSEQFRRSGPAASTPRRSSVIGQGILTVTANAIGGRIFINDENTEKESDHVFTGLPYGEYRVRVERPGFRSIPEEKMVVIDHNSPSAGVDFELIKEFERLQVKTEPSNAPIYINGELKGTGNFSEEMKSGEYEISFGNVAGFNTPRPRLIRLTPNRPVDLSVSYFPQIRAIASVSGDGNINTSGCDIVPGYSFSNRGFIGSTEAGPEVVYNEKTKKYFWKFGYAFPFRNPKGSDALKMSFNLPKEFQNNSRFVLKLAAATSEEKYPLAVSRKVDVTIKLNGNILSYYYQPKVLEEIGGTDEVSWDVTEHVNAGVNTLEISVTDRNNAYFYVKKIEINNIE